MDVQSLIDRAGGVGKLASLLGVKHNTVSDWKRENALPGARVAQISENLGVPLADVARLVRQRRARVVTDAIGEAA